MLRLNKIKCYENSKGISIQIQPMLRLNGSECRKIYLENCIQIQPMLRLNFTTVDSFFFSYFYSNTTNVKVKRG